MTKYKKVRKLERKVFRELGTPGKIPESDSYRGLQVLDVTIPFMSLERRLHEGMIETWAENGHVKDSARNLAKYSAIGKELGLNGFDTLATLFQELDERLTNDGYDDYGNYTSQCTRCNGKGTITAKNRECPDCEGSGVETSKAITSLSVSSSWFEDFIRNLTADEVSWDDSICRIAERCLEIKLYQKYPLFVSNPA